MTPPYRSYVVVSREQIALNYRNVRSVVGPDVEVAGVVKADAYGHGAVEVSRVLVAEGAKWLAVSSVEEGVNLRRGGIRHARILVMGGFLAYEGDALVAAMRSVTRIWPACAFCMSRAATLTSLPNTPNVRRVGPPYAPVRICPRLTPICISRMKLKVDGGVSRSSPAKR